MTQLIMPVQGDVVEIVFSKVHFTSGGPGVGDNFGKVASDSVVTAATEVWEKIKTLLLEASKRGWDAVQPLVTELNAIVEDRANELMHEAARFRNLLLDKLNEAMQEVLELVLRSIKSRVRIGEDNFTLASIDLQTKLVYSGSIEASITALCKFVASGETTITGKYSIAPP